jgi:hypothetical protein
MGMFDYLRCSYPLPLEGANARDYQTKDTPTQLLDNYEIREDGSLWRQSVDYDEDTKDSPFTQLETFTGEIRFYDSTGSKKHGGWIEWSAHFTNGKIAALKLIENR